MAKTVSTVRKNANNVEQYQKKQIGNIWNKPKSLYVKLCKRFNVFYRNIKIFVYTKNDLLYVIIIMDKLK